MPGFTPISMYPRMWAATGVDYPKLLTALVGTALRPRHRPALTQKAPVIVCQIRKPFSAMIRRGDHRGDGRGGEPPVDQLGHEVAAAGEQHQRYQRERDAERQHHLGEHQRLGRVDADAEHDQRGREGERRRSSSGIRRWMKPCIITCPA